MDLGLSRRGDYLVRAAIALGRAAGSDGYVKVREVAKEMDLPPRYAPQILNLLVKAGLAESRAGHSGGYRLTRAPDDISLLQLLEIGEGSLSPRICTLRGGPCHWEEMCAIHPAWEAAYKAWTDVLRDRSLASVIATDRGLETGELEVPTEVHPEKRARLARPQEVTY